MTKPLSLRGFIRQSGGLWEKPGGMTGELRHLREGCHGLVNSKTGRPLDRAREAAAEAGYLGPCIDTAMSETTLQDLLDALYSDAPVYSVFDESEIFDLAKRRDEREWKRAVREYSYADETGLVDAAEGMEAFEYLADGGTEQAAAPIILPKACPAPQDPFERLGRRVAAFRIVKALRRAVSAIPEDVFCLAFGAVAGAVLCSSLSNGREKTCQTL